MPRPAPAPVCVHVRDGTRPHKAQGRCNACYAVAFKQRRLTLGPLAPPWTPRDDAWLERYYRRGYPSCAARLGRSAAAVRARCKRLGLGLRTEYSLTDLARAVGCSAQTACTWHRSGRLKVHGRGYLEDADLHRFLCEYPDAWTLFPCPGRVWLDGLLQDPALCKAHGCPPATQPPRTPPPLPRPDVPAYAGVTQRRGHRYREWD